MGTPRNSLRLGTHTRHAKNATDVLARCAPAQGGGTFPRCSTDLSAAGAWFSRRQRCGHTRGGCAREIFRFSPIAGEQTDRPDVRLGRTFSNRRPVEHPGMLRQKALSIPSGTGRTPACRPKTGVFLPVSPLLAQSDKSPRHARFGRAETLTSQFLRSGVETSGHESGMSPLRGQILENIS
jgi:hypothetical protein